MTSSTLPAIRNRRLPFLAPRAEGRRLGHGERARGGRDATSLRSRPPVARAAMRNIGADMVRTTLQASRLGRGLARHFGATKASPILGIVADLPAKVTE